jgi:hypothetical protein
MGQQRPSGGFSRALIIRTLVCLGILAAPLSFPLASSAFMGSTADDANSASSAEVAPPTGFGVSQTCAPGPGIALRAVSSAGNGGLLDTVTVSRPTGTIAGDFLVAQIANRQSAYTLNPPAGWTLLRRESGGSTVGTMATSAVFWRWAAAGDPGTWTWTLSGSPGVQMVGGIAGYSGVHPASPINASGVASGISVSASTPSITTTVAGTMLVHLLAKRQEQLPAPTGTTARWSLLSGAGATNLGVAAGDESFPGPGATTSRVSTFPGNTSTSLEWVAHTLALRPAVGPPSAALTWTASPSTWATGYRLERSVGGTVQATATVTGIGTTSTTDGTLVNGTTYAFRLWAYRGTWISTSVTATLTPSC